MLSVPQGVFKEPGALLVVAQVVNPGAATGTVRRVQQLAVSTAGCERHVYVRNRFTAIRLNRSQDRAPN